MAFRNSTGPSIRVGVTVPIAVTAAGFGAPIQAILVNISDTGCRLTARSIFLTGTAVRFDLPRAGSPPLKLQGTVRNMEPGGIGGGGNEYGVEFSALSRADADAFRAFVAREQHAAANVVRVETDFPVRCTLLGGRETVSAVALDVSRGGMRHEVARRLSDDSHVMLKFKLGASRELQVEARVLRGSQRPRGEFHYSVLFVNPAGAFVEELDRFLRAGR